MYMFNVFAHNIFKETCNKGKADMYMFIVVFVYNSFKEPAIKIGDWNSMIVGLQPLGDVNKGANTDMIETGRLAPWVLNDEISPRQ